MASAVAKRAAAAEKAAAEWAAVEWGAGVEEEGVRSSGGFGQDRSPQRRQVWRPARAGTSP